ncbi:MAG: hypothetical protein Q8K83_02510 [Methylotenera sp.]|nr:hypothetical protein [Methylotenera sp.]MDZ4141758.1 hypothetical protein [Methylotenera sp.]
MRCLGTSAFGSLTPSKPHFKLAAALVASTLPDSKTVRENEVLEISRL